MTHSDDIAAGLPAPRDDEPSALRRDIIDELADHLRAAVARERLCDDSAPRRSDREALNAAIEHFGDPAAVARRLWWDAMKERIMTQQIRLLAAAVAGAFVAISLVFMWQMFRNFQDVNAAIEDLQRQVAVRNGDGTLTYNLDSANSPAEPAPEKPQTPFVLITLRDATGKPVQGEVTLNAGPANSESARTDADGDADLGRHEFGVKYPLAIVLDGSGATATVYLSASEEYQAITCPPEVPPVPVCFKIDPPTSLVEKPLYYLAQLERTSIRAAGRAWTVPTSAAPDVFLLDSRGKILGSMSPIDVGEERLAAVSGGGLASGRPAGAYAAEWSFTAEIPASVGMTEARDLPPGTYNLILAAFTVDPRIKNALADRPALVSLRGMTLLHRTFELSADGKSTFRIGDHDRAEVDFWRNVRGRLEVLPAELFGPSTEVEAEPAR